MPSYGPDCDFLLDGVAHKGLDAFLDYLLTRDATVTPEQRDTDLERAQAFGYENVHEAIGSVNKRLGLTDKGIGEVGKGTLYHGSRFKFENFDTEKVNTGQVSQDFGWGLYFTSKKEVGEHYANMLFNTKKAIEKYSDNIKTFKDDILKDYIDKENVVGAKRRIETLLKDEKLNATQKEELNNLKSSLDEVQRYGYLYKTSFDKNAKFLNYSENISKADLDKINEGLKEKIETNKGVPVAVVYNQLVKQLGSKKEASLYLLSKGFHGFKYEIDTLGKKGFKDNENEFNYTVFDPSVLDKPEQQRMDFKGQFKLDTPSYTRNQPTTEPTKVGEGTREPYQYLKDISDEELRQASKERRKETFDKKVDDIVDKILKLPGIKPIEGTQLGAGAGAAEAVIKKAADIIKAAYDAKEDIKEAIGKALDYIRDNWNKATMGEYDERKIADLLHGAGALSIDEEIERTLGISPEDVLNIWNSVDVGRNNPELLSFIQSLSGAEKKEIVKNAMAGIVSSRLQKFIRTIKEKTGRKIDIMEDQEFKDMVEQRIREEALREMAKREAAKDELRNAMKLSQTSEPLKDRLKNAPMVTWVRDVSKGFALMFHPALFEGKELARDAMMLIRKEKGKEAQVNEMADIASRKIMNEWNWVPKIDKLGFILSLENPKKYGTADPEYKALADQYRERMDAVFKMISEIRDIPYMEDYFPHFWQKPEKARAFFAQQQVYSKRPFEGNKSFLKQRFYADILEGLNAGLKLATDNPEEMVRLAEMNALKFKTAHDIFYEMKDRGLLRYFKNGEQPEGWKLVDDPLFRRMALFTVKGEEGKTEAAMTRGGYYMPEPVARVVNNYLSRGLSGSGPLGRNVYEAVRGWNNAKNLFQLGFGLFHFTTTTVDSTVTGIGNAISDIMSGKPKGLVDLAGSLTILPNIVKTLIRADPAIKGYRKGSINSDVQAMIDANARTGLSKIYTLDSYYNLRKAIGKLYADKDFSQLKPILKNTLLFLPEAFSKPLMEWYVPRLKVGGYLRTLDRELSKKPGLTEKEILREKQRIWDDMDDRLGQMVYDNLFWHKTQKDLAFMTIRSFGWTGGTIRAFGKGIGEVPDSVKRLFKGQGLSPRTSWLLTLPVSVGLYGAMWQYLHTGTWPQEMEDYFFPWDGTMNADGTKHRQVIPSYMKDFFAYMKHPFETASHKTAPTFNEVIEIFENKDFYGTKIIQHKGDFWDNDDTLFQNGLNVLRWLGEDVRDIGKYEAQTLIPFSFKEPPGQQPTHRQWIEQKFGIMPATKEFQRSATQTNIITELQKEYGDEAKTQQDAERINARRQIREELFRGQQPTQDEWDKAAYSSKTKSEVLKDATLDPYKRMFRDLKSEAQLKVWSKMTPAEKEDYKQYLNNKSSFEELYNNKPELFNEKMQKAYDEIVGETHETRGAKKGTHEKKKWKVFQ